MNEICPWLTAAGEVTLLLTADPPPLPAEESVAGAAAIEAAPGAAAAAVGVTKSCRHFLTRFLARLAR